MERQIWASRAAPFRHGDPPLLSRRRMLAHCRIPGMPCFEGGNSAPAGGIGIRESDPTWIARPNPRSRNPDEEDPVSSSASLGCGSYRPVDQQPELDSLVADTADPAEHADHAGSAAFDDAEHLEHSEHDAADGPECDSFESERDESEFDESEFDCRAAEQQQQRVQQQHGPAS